MRRADVVFLLGVFALFGLAACQTTTHTVTTTDAGCIALGPLTYSRADTVPTVRGIVGHNAAWHSLCPAGAPGSKLAPPAAVTSADACPFDVAREDRRGLARAVAALRQASEVELASLRASYGVSRQQFAACLADAEAALR